MANMTLAEMFRINPLINTVLLVCSILLVAYLIERVWAFMRIGSLDRNTAERVKMHVRQGQIKEAIALCERDKSYFSDAVAVALKAASFPREEMENIFALYRAKLSGMLNAHLGLFGTLAFTGPLIGLLGTVMGVIRAFRDLALSGSGGPSIVAAGIAEALFATAGGIGVALIAAVFYNLFVAMAKGRIAQFDQLGQEIAILVYTGSEKGR